MSVIMLDGLCLSLNQRHWRSSGDLPPTGEERVISPSRTEAKYV
jgi:hypothetical protein